MKTRIPIKRYVPDEKTKRFIDRLVATDATTLLPSTIRTTLVATAKEYKKLEAHYAEETTFLIKRIEELEAKIEELETKLENQRNELQEMINR
jgi:chaperonin cofactor prefoldin